MAVLVKDAARDAAEAALASYWRARPAPIDPVAIAEEMGIKVVRAPLDDGVSGMIVKRPGTDAVIYVERSDSDARQVFTVAHELGHFVERTQLGNEPMDEFAFVETRTPKHDVHEYFANEFAGNLLMPATALTALAENFPLDRKARFIDLAFEVASTYNVSTTAARERLNKLGLL